MPTFSAYAIIFSKLSYKRCFIICSVASKPACPAEIKVYSAPMDFAKSKDLYTYSKELSRMLSFSHIKLNGYAFNSGVYTVTGMLYFFINSLILFAHISRS